MVAEPMTDDAGDGPHTIVLASGSPRRHDLLRELGVAFDVVVPDVDEAAIAAGRSPADAVTALAAAKLAATQKLLASDRDRVVIACDTMVVGLDGAPIGKPADRSDARRLLESFSNSTIVVMSGLAIAGGADPDASIETVNTTVTLRPISVREIDAYVATGAADDKAGGLELQGRAASFIEAVDGCWTNVVGLPVCRVSAALAASAASSDDALVDNAGCADVEADARSACGCRVRPDLAAVRVDDLLDDR